MVLLLLPSQSVLALPRPQLVNGRAVTISSGTAETAVCMPLSAAAHSEPHSQLVARLVSTRERAQALAAASAALLLLPCHDQLRHCRDRGLAAAHSEPHSRAAREHEGASSGTRSCISRSSAAQLGSACAPTAHSRAAGRHDWEVAIVDYMDGDLFFVGVCRPDADITASHFRQEHTTAWLISDGGRLFGNGKGGGTYALVAPSVIVNGDRMGILLDLDDSSLRFFRNGVEHGPGYPAGSVTGPVALAAHMSHEGTALRLLPDAAWPAGHAQ